MTRIAFIGLGTMGFPMAGHLQRRYPDLTVFNRSRSRADAWLEQYRGAQAADSPAAAARGTDVVLTCVGNDDDLREVVLGEQGLIHGLKKDAVLVDHSTVSAGVSRAIASTLAAMGAHFVDAPVSGGEQGARNGQLAIMCGGAPEVFARIKPVIECYAKAVTLMGPTGSGQLTKMVNQICVAGLIEALAEGIYFAEKAGLDAQKVMDVISQGAASSWQMVNRHKTMIQGEYEHGFAVDWMRKDLGICLDEAARMGVTLPVTQQVDQLYAELQAMGTGRWDTSSLLARLKKQA